MMSPFLSNTRLVLIGVAGVAAAGWWAYVFALQAIEAGRERRRAAVVIHAPRGLLALALLATAGAVMIAVLAARSNAWETAALMLGVFALPSILGSAVLLARHELVDGGMVYDGPLGDRRRFNWEDVVSIQCNGPDWFRVQTADGRIARVGFLLRNIDAFARAALEGCPLAALTPSAVEMLRRAAENKPWWDRLT